MKITNTIALAFTVLTTVVANDKVSIQLSNDQSGANANVDVRADGVKRPIDHLWANTAVDDHGTVRATSTQLTDFKQDTSCSIFQEHPHVGLTLDAEHTWASLSDGAVVPLEHAFVVCH